MRLRSSTDRFLGLAAYFLQRSVWKQLQSLFLKQVSCLLYQWRGSPKNEVVIQLICIVEFFLGEKNSCAWLGGRTKKDQSGPSGKLSDSEVEEKAETGEAYICLLECTHVYVCVWGSTGI